MTQWRRFVLGAVTFLLAHAAIVVGTAWFDPSGRHAAWFLNSGRGVAFTVVCLAVASAATASFRPYTFRERVVAGMVFAAGAAIGMTAILLSGDPGTIFPIVLVVGWLIALASGVAGALVAGAVRGVSEAG